MAAANTDKFKKVAPNTGWQLDASGIANAIVTNFGLVSASSIPTDTAVIITVDRIDAGGAKTPAKMERIIGVMSGNSVLSCIRGVGGTAQPHPGGAVVEIVIADRNINDMIDGILVDHNQTGTHKNNVVIQLRGNGSDIDAGTDDTKIVTPKSIKDSSILFSSFIQRQGIINGGMEVSQENVASAVALVNNTAKYACDLISVTPSGTAVSAGTQAQISNSTIGTSGYALKLAGVTITGAGTIKKRYRVEAADAVKYKNKPTSFSMLELQDTGGSLNYTIQINKANSADNFSAVTQIAISGNLAVPTGAGTLIKLENVSMGDCSNGIEICVTIPCGAITTKNFETTEWQMNVGAVALPFVCGSRTEELAKVKRYVYNVLASSTSSGSMVGNGHAFNTTTALLVVPLQIQMRITPTITFTLADFTTLMGGGGFAPTAITVDASRTYPESLVLLVAVSTGYVVGYGVNMNANAAGKKFIIDARFTA